MGKVKDKISEDDRKAISDKCDEAIKWLDANQLAEVEEFNAQQKEVEAVCNPIITKLYADVGGAGECLEVCQTWEVWAVWEVALELLLVLAVLDPPSRKLIKSPSAVFVKLTRILLLSAF